MSDSGGRGQRGQPGVPRQDERRHRTVDPASRAEQALRLTLPSGGEYRMRVSFGSWQYGSGLPTRSVLDGPVLVGIQKAVTAAAASSIPDAFALLEGEARVAARLAYRYPDDYPAELVRLIGYDLDGDMPYLLLKPNRGEPVGSVAGELPLDAQRQFEASLLLGLLCLHEAGVVHGDINADSVRWDGQRVQISDLGTAQLIGERRRRGVAPAWAAPQHRAGQGVVTGADDVWSAGMLIYHVVTGRSVDGARGAPAVASRGAALQSLLDGVFASEEADRPEAAELLRRLRVAPTVPGGPADPDATLEEGRAAFESLLRQKQAFVAERETFAFVRGVAPLVQVLTSPSGLVIVAAAVVVLLFAAVLGAIR